MTEIKYYRYPMKLDVQGHVPSDGEGENLLCCAVSTLMYGLTAALDVFGIEYSAKVSYGGFAVTLLPKFEKASVASIMLEAFAAALFALAGQSEGRIVFLSLEAEECAPDL